MNKQSLELQIQQATQKDISNLKHDVMQLIQAYEAINHNQKQIYTSTILMIQNLTIRLNFLMERLAKEVGEEKLKKEIEEYEKNERTKISEKIAELQKDENQKGNIKNENSQTT